MPTTDTIRVGKDWIELSNSDITSFSVQNTGSNNLLVQATDGTAPTVDNGSIVMLPYSCIANQQLSEFWVGLSAPTRLFARCPSADGCDVFISHN